MAHSAGIEVTVPWVPEPLQGPVDMAHMERTDTGQEELMLRSVRGTGWDKRYS